MTARRSRPSLTHASRRLPEADRAGAKADAEDAAKSDRSKATFDLPPDLVAEAPGWRRC